MVILTLLPDYTLEDGKPVKTSEMPENPLLLLEAQDEDGKVVEKKQLAMGKQVTIGNYDYSFTDLRQW